MRRRRRLGRDEFVDAERFLARVKVSSVHRIVNVALVAGDHGANVSGWVLLHVGLAISRIDEHVVGGLLERDADRPAPRTSRDGGLNCDRMRSALVPFTTLEGSSISLLSGVRHHCREASE